MPERDTDTSTVDAGSKAGSDATRAAATPGHDSADLYLSILRDFPALIWRSDPDGRCDWFNTAWLEFRGRTIAEEYGDGWAEGVHVEDLERCVEIWREHLADRTAFEMDYRLRRHDGDYRWIRDHGRPFWGQDGAFLGFIGACYDITDLLEMAERLETLATQDPLTGIPNRRAFVAEVERAISFANRGGKALVVFADVDRFKTVNDRYGHETGDKVLTEIAQAMSEVLRGADMVARIGGDEFGCVLRERTDVPAKTVTRRLTTAVERVGRAHGVDLGLSIGTAEIVPDATASDTLAEADRRMYEAKSVAAGGA